MSFAIRSFRWLVDFQLVASLAGISTPLQECARESVVYKVRLPWEIQSELSIVFRLFSALAGCSGTFEPFCRTAETTATRYTSHRRGNAFTAKVARSITKPDTLLDLVQRELPIFWLTAQL